MGRAAVTERMELADYNYEMWVKEEREKLIAREDELLRKAVGMDGFDVFWDTVPDFGSRRERIRLLEEFIGTQA